MVKIINFNKYMFYNYSFNYFLNIQIIIVVITISGVS